MMKSNFSILLITILSTLLFNSCKDDKVDGQWFPPTSNQPNVLLVIADDMSIEACPGYGIGATKPHMPNLQKLIDNGVSFDNFWTKPICSPTRATILSGKYGYNSGVLDVQDNGTIKADEKTLHQYINEISGNGYSHSIIGKWHLSPREPNRPTQMGIGYYAGLLGGAVSDYGSWQFTENGQTTTSNEYVTKKFTNLAIDWINDQDKPGFQDFGEVNLTGNGGHGYIRLDWFTPDALPTWGDGRLLILGDKGYIEIRKYTDLAKSQSGNHLYYANNEEVNHIDCRDVKLPYFRNLINDVLNRSETACSQELTYLTMELAIHAQELAEKK